MGFAEAITRRPLLVVAVWLVVALVALPLFAKLSSVVHERMYTLPSSSESMRATNLMKQIRSTIDTHIGIVIVDNVDLRDNETLLKLVRWGKLYNETIVGRYASKAEAVPIMLAAINETLYSQMLKALNMTVNGTLTLYRTLVSLDQAWNKTLANITSMAEQLNRTVEAIVQADKGYTEAYHGLLQLAEALNRTYHGLISLDRAYANATEQLALLAAKLNTTAQALSQLDTAYASLYSLRSRAQQLVASLSNKTLALQLSRTLGFLWWQVSRTYYYMNLTGGNYTLYASLTNLTMVKPELKPLSREEALKAYNAVRELVAGGYGVDEASLKVAESLAGSMLPEQAKQLLPVVAGFWNKTMEEYRARLGVPSLANLYTPPPRHVESQLRLLQLAENISATTANTLVENAGRIAAEIIAEQLKAQGLSESLALKLAWKAVNGTLTARDAAAAAASLAAESGKIPAELAGKLAEILLAYDPDATGLLASNRTLALEASAKLLEAAGAPRQAVEALLTLLLREAQPSRRELAVVAAKLVEQQVPPEARQLLAVVVKLDPEALGVLASNHTLAAEAAAETVYRAAVGKGEKIDRNVVLALAKTLPQGGPSSGALRKLALSMLEREVEERAGRQAAALVVSIIERFDPDATGRIAENETLAILALYQQAKAKGLPLSFEEFEELVRNPSKARDVAAKVFEQMAVEKAPEQAREMVRQLAGIVVREGPGLQGDRAWSIVERMVAENAKKQFAALRSRLGFEPPDWLPTAVAKAAVAVARGGASLESEALSLAHRLLLETVAPRLLEESERLMVSKDYKAFTVMLTPLGETQKERAGNVEKAGEKARELLSKLGIGGARVYVSGEDVLLQQVRSYAMKDAERASKLSEAGTFIVLLVLLESLFAVVLPYLGIFLGLALGGAIVYLAASHGVIDFSSHTQSVMITTALGLGADYAGYLVHRFREEYALTGDAREAARRSLKRAGPAIVASALTVMIGFGSLLLAWDISFIRGFGEAIPIAVGATALATLTLVPALLTLLGGRRWFWWPRRPSRERLGRESRLMGFLVRHEKAVVAAVIALIAVAGYFYATFQGSHDMKLMLPEKAPALEATRILSEKFEAGITDPIYIVVKLPNSLWQSNTTVKLLEELTRRIEEIPNVAIVMTPLQPTGKPLPLSEARRMGAGLVSQDGRLALIQVILSVDPYSREGVKTVRKIHDVVHSYAQQHGLEVYVDGSPYATLEMDDILTHEFYTRVLPAAATLMILTFTAIFGGFTVSIAALLVIIGAAMTGIMASVLVFQHLIGKPVLWFLHIISLAAVMGVGMDYNSFFLARALEEYQKTGDPKKAVVKAAGAVSKFIIGLSLVVTVAYLALLTASNTGMKEMGFTLATTVFVAGLMASYLLTPLVVSMLGRHAWWPWGLKKRVEH